MTLHVKPCLFYTKIIFFVPRCEKGVMSSVNVRNCIRFYQTAEELNASTLMNYCGEIIASHWVNPVVGAMFFSITTYLLDGVS